MGKRTDICASTRAAWAVGTVKLLMPLVVPVLIALAGAEARAQETVDCENALTQMEMTYCAEKDWQNADAELNAAYKAAMARMQEMDGYLDENLKGAAAALREAQRAWIPYRDKACEAYGFLARGGTLEPQLIYACLADLTGQRTTELNELAEGLGN